MCFSKEPNPAGAADTRLAREGGGSRAAPAVLGGGSGGTEGGRRVLILFSAWRTCPSSREEHVEHTEYFVGVSLPGTETCPGEGSRVREGFPKVTCG